MFSKNKTVFTLFRRYHFALALTIVFALLALEGLFLYRYFYQSLLATNSLVELSEQVTLENLKQSSYEKIQTFYENRKSLPAINLKTVRDPFSETSLPRE
ncbi:MAG: hypothetical protein Q7S48_01620 [bacterium]|nr:hypothetical protein [bacterium]